MYGLAPWITLCYSLQRLNRCPESLPLEKQLNIIKALKNYVASFHQDSLAENNEEIACWHCLKFSDGKLGFYDWRCSKNGWSGSVTRYNTEFQSMPSHFSELLQGSKQSISAEGTFLSWLRGFWAAHVKQESCKGWLLKLELTHMNLRGLNLSPLSICPLNPFAGISPPVMLWFLCKDFGVISALGKCSWFFKDRVQDKGFNLRNWTKCG